METYVRIARKTLLKPRLRVDYPQLKGVTNRRIERELNRVLLAKSYEMIRDHGYVSDRTKVITGNYEVKLNRQGLISLVLEQFAYAEGAAHGLTLRTSFNAYALTGERLEFDDLFIQGGYRELAEQEIKKQIRERDLSLIAEFESLGKDPDYYLAPEGIVIYFQLYEYTPYALGFPEFVLPYAMIGDKLRPDLPFPR